MTPARQLRIREQPPGTTIAFSSDTESDLSGVSSISDPVGVRVAKRAREG